MKDSGRGGGKKIVFKKRILASQALPAEVTPAIDATSEQGEQAQDLSHYYYQGEIFDQFYRPLSIEGGEELLTEIAQEPLAPPSPEPRLAKVARDVRNKEQQETAEALAHQLYNLAQKVRETDIDVYLSAVNVVLAERGAKESKEILDKTNDFFTEHYYTAIRDRGERPEIYHQIIKRVGHAASERIGRIVNGLDVEGTAKIIWNLYHGDDPDKAARITTLLLACTERQIRALREEFLLIPYKDLARQLFLIINPTTTTEVQSAGRRTIGKSEVSDTRKLAAYKSRDQLKSIKYLLLGRNATELALIKRFYLDSGDQDAHESEIGLEVQVQKVFQAIDLDRMGNLFLGWSPNGEAEELHKILFPKTMTDGLEDLLSDPKDSVDRDHTQGIGPFLRRFKKQRMWRNRNSIRHRVLNSYELIAERLNALSFDRFMRTNDALQDQFGYEIDPSLFSSLGLFDARRRAFVMNEHIAASFDLTQMLKHVEFLPPRECMSVQQAFRSLFGLEVREAIEQRLTAVKVKVAAKELQELLVRYLDGQGRWPLNLDLLARYRGAEPTPGVWEPDFITSEQDEQVAIDCAQLMDRDADLGELDLPILEVLRKHSYEELNRIERAFYELTDPQVPLRIALSECLSAEVLSEVELLLNGVELAEVVSASYDDPATLQSVRDIPPSHISVIRESFEKTHLVDLSAHLLERLPDPEEEDLLIDTLAIVLAPEAHAFHTTLRAMRRDTPQDMEKLRRHWRGSALPSLLALERAFDRDFPRLRQHLKFGAARIALTPELFAESILHLEGIDPEIVPRFLECFDSVDIDLLQQRLRDNKLDQRTIEQVFDLLYPDATLRRCIKEMKVDLDLINETLLHLEGYSSKEVATEIHNLTETLSAEQLGIALLDVLATPAAGYINPRIPEDLNWMDEMMYQIGLSFQRNAGQDLVSVARARGVPTAMLEELTSRLFGQEVCASARELFNLIKLNKEGQSSSEYTEARSCSYLESRGVRHRDRLLRAYNTFWAHIPGFGNLIDDVTKFFIDPTLKQKTITMLIGVSAEHKKPADSAETSR